MHDSAASLDRFVEAQAPVWNNVVAELKAGRKTTHWMWFVFPQLASLGRSSTARFYGLRDLDEARGYAAHPLLGARLHECCALLLQVQGRSALDIFGDIDAMKLRSCLTLFAIAAPADVVFARCLDRYYGGEMDPLTRSQADPLKHYYRVRAQEYDKIYLKPERQADLRAMEAWLPTVFKGKRVLEVACGTGYWTQFIAPAAESMVAIDASNETLEVAKSRGRMANVQWRQGDAYDLPRFAPLPDAAFAGFWISHVPRKRVAEFLAGLHARIAPGSSVVLLDNRYVPGSSTPHGAPDEAGDTYQDRKLDDGTAHRVLKNFPDESEVRGWLVGAASTVRWHVWEHYWAVEYFTSAAQR